MALRPFRPKDTANITEKDGAYKLFCKKQHLGNFSGNRQKGNLEIVAENVI